MDTELPCTSISGEPSGATVKDRGTDTLPDMPVMLCSPAVRTGLGDAPFMNVAMELPFTVCVADATVVPSMVTDQVTSTA